MAALRSNAFRHRGSSLSRNRVQTITEHAMCGIQSAESASFGGTIRTLERALAEARATIANLTDEVARLRVLQRAFTTNCRCQPKDKTRCEKQSAEMRGHSSTAVGKRTAIFDCD